MAPVPGFQTQKKTIIHPAVTLAIQAQIQKNLYKIAGDSSVTVDQMVKYFKQSKCIYPSKDLSKGGAKDIKTFAKIVLEEANAEGIKAEVVFCQAMKETGWLQFWRRCFYQTV